MGSSTAYRNQQHQQERKVDEAVDRLRQHGFIVNNADTLRPKSGGIYFKPPKVFKRPISLAKIALDEGAFKSIVMEAESTSSVDDSMLNRPQKSEDIDEEFASSSALRVSSESHSYEHSEHVYHVVDQESVEERISRSSSAGGHSINSSRKHVDCATSRVPTFQPTVESKDDDSNGGAEDGDSIDLKKEIASDVPSVPARPASIRNEGHSIFTDLAGERSTKAAEGPKKTPEVPDRDLRQVIREEITAMLKYTEDEFDGEVKRRLEDEMTKRLAVSGYEEHQIQNKLNPQKYKQPTKTSPSEANRPDSIPQKHQPVHFEISKQYLAVDRLVCFDIPYEVGQNDPKYIIILRDRERREIDNLLEHTRRLRATAVKRKKNEPESACVRRRTGSSHSTSGRLSSPQRLEPRSGTSLDASPGTERSLVRRKRSQRAVTPDSKPYDPPADIMDPPLPRNKEAIRVILQIPPFLTWPTTFSKTTETSVSRPGICRIYRMYNIALFVNP